MLHAAQILRWLTVHVSVDCPYTVTAVMARLRGSPVALYLLAPCQHDKSYNDSICQFRMHLPYLVMSTFPECIMAGRYKPSRHRLQTICIKSRQAANDVPSPAPAKHLQPQPWLERPIWSLVRLWLGISIATYWSWQGH